jgi:hypothetical protein
MNQSAVLVPILSLLALTACIEGMVCTASVEPAVIVEIRDAVDDQPLAADAVGWVREGTFSDSLRAYGLTLDGALVSRAGADEREGTYVAQVSHAGYADWEQTGVRVKSDGCHVETAHLQARLVRVP